MVFLSSDENVSALFVFFPAQRALLYHNTNTEVKGNIQEKNAGCSKHIINLSTQKASFCLC